MFHLPIAALAWGRISIKPLILQVSSNQMRSKLVNKTLEYLDKLKAIQMHIRVEPGYEKLAAVTSRLFFGLLPDIGECKCCEMTTLSSAATQIFIR